MLRTQIAKIYSDSDLLSRLCTLCVHYVCIMCALCVHYVCIMCVLCVHYAMSCNELNVEIDPPFRKV